MEKEVIVLFLLGILLVSPLVLAQEQAQTYSGFGRFVDNVKMFFSSGDNKVMLALEIREKEINSAIINTQKGNDKEAEKNLERAIVKLRFVQNKVSENIAEDVKTNVNEIINKINKDGDLTDSFERYILEEEKTGLTAELVVEVKGKEGQVQEQNRTREIETRMNEIDNAIVDVVESKIDIDMDKKDPDATPKTPRPTDGSICCKKIINGKEQYHWDPKDVCLDSENVAGIVVDDDFCLALGDAINEEDDVITEGVPEECASQGVYDKEGCGKIMAKVPVCCKHNIEGEIKYEMTPGDICVSPNRERVDESFCS